RRAGGGRLRRGLGPPGLRARARAGTGGRGGSRARRGAPPVARALPPVRPHGPRRPHRPPRRPHRAKADRGLARRRLSPLRCAAPRHGAGSVCGRGTGPIMAPVSLPGPARGPDNMIIDRETFTELAVHLKLASDAILKTARHLAVLSNGDSSNEEQWAGTLDS